MQAAVYCRVSTDEQARHGLSMAVQETDCSRAAREAGATDVVVYRDEGHTGMTLDRPALQSMLSRLGDYDMLVVWTVDRLARPLEDRLEILRILGAAGIRWWALHEHVDVETDDGLLMYHIGGAISEYQVRRIRSNVRAALASRVADGLPPTGRVPYGYRSENGRPKLVPEQAARVREACRRYRHGATISELVRYLRDEDPSLVWYHRGVRYMLRNRFYRGDVRHQDAWHPGQHDAIVSAQVWHAVQRRLDEQARVHPKSRVRSYASALRCGVCGGGMATVGRSPEKGGYMCLQQRQARGPDARTHSSYVARRTCDAIVWGVVQRIVAQPGGIMITSDTELLAELEAQEADLARQAATLLDSVVRQATPPRLYAAKSLELDTALHSVRQQIVAQREQQSRLEAARAAVGHRLKPDMAMPLRIEVVRRVVDHVSVHREDGRRELEFRFPWTTQVYTHEIPRRWSPGDGDEGLGLAPMG